MTTIVYHPEKFDAFKKGDEIALGFFFDQLNRVIYRYLQDKGADEDLAWEITVCAFNVAWERRSKYKNEQHLRASLYRIAYNKFINQKRRGKAWKRILKGYSEWVDEAVTIEEDEEIVRAHLIDQLHQAIAELPQQQRLAVRMVYLENMDYKTAAEMLEVEPQTVRNHCSAAKAKLKDKFGGLEFPFILFLIFLQL